MAMFKSSRAAQRTSRARHAAATTRAPLVQLPGVRVELAQYTPRVGRLARLPSPLIASVHQDALVLVLEPLLRLLLVNAVPNAHGRLPGAPLRHTHAARALHHDVKVHAVDAGGRVVLEACDHATRAEGHVRAVAGGRCESGATGLSIHRRQPAGGHRRASARFAASQAWPI